MNTPHPQSLRCPICGNTPTTQRTQTAPAITTIYMTCATGHHWDLRWMPEVVA